jgi:hypothetical protein
MLAAECLKRPVRGEEGTSCTQELDLVGLLPSAVTTIDEQAKRSYAQYQQQPDAEDSNTPPPVRGDLFGDVSFWPY